MNSSQHRTGSRCNEEKPTVINNLPIAVKRIQTVKRQPVVADRPEQPPIVKVERRVKLRRQLARLREDYQSVSRFKEHIEMDMSELEQQLGKKNGTSKK